jgi:hypothetical protein
MCSKYCTRSACAKNPSSWIWNAHCDGLSVWLFGKSGNWFGGPLVPFCNDTEGHRAHSQATGNRKYSDKIYLYWTCTDFVLVTSSQVIQCNNYELSTCVALGIVNGAGCLWCWGLNSGPCLLAGVLLLDSCPQSFLLLFICLIGSCAFELASNLSPPTYVCCTADFAMCI